MDSVHSDRRRKNRNQSLERQPRIDSRRARVSICACQYSRARYPRKMIISACPSPLSRISLQHCDRRHCTCTRPLVFFLLQRILSKFHSAIQVLLLFHSSPRVFSIPPIKSFAHFSSPYRSNEIRHSVRQLGGFSPNFFPQSRQESRIKLHLREADPSRDTLPAFCLRDEPALHHNSSIQVAQLRAKQSRGPCFKSAVHSTRPPVPTRFNPIRSTTFTKFYRTHPLQVFSKIRASLHICLRLSIDPLRGPATKRWGARTDGRNSQFHLRLLIGETTLHIHA